MRTLANYIKNHIVNIGANIIAFMCWLQALACRFVKSTNRMVRSLKSLSAKRTRINHTHEVAQMLSRQQIGELDSSIAERTIRALALERKIISLSYH